MSLMSKRFRERATEQRDLSSAIDLDAATFKTEPKMQCAFVVARVTANVLDALADATDYLGAVAPLNSLAERRQQIMELNDAIRKAAARKDWVEFDRLTDKIISDAGGVS